MNWHPSILHMTSSTSSRAIRSVSRGAWLALLLLPAFVPGQVLTIQVGAPLPPTTALVQHGNTWSWRRGTNEPQGDWRTINDAGLDATWLSGAGGFGYGDPGILGEGTTLTGMRNVHSTLYIRREFNLGVSIDPTAELLLTVDYDDGFVVYLDGVELTRRNLSGASNSPVAFNALSITSHEASCCTAPVNPASVISFGPVGNRLAAGAHVLAFIAMSDDINSSDLHIIPDLVAAPSTSGGVVNNGAYALTTTNVLALSGSNTLAGSVRVTVNGDDVTFNPANGAWSASQALNPGWNRLYVAAHDANGQILSNLTQDVIYQTTSLTIGGTLLTDLIASNAGTVLYVTSNVAVPTNTTFEVADGAIVLVDAGRSIVAQNGGHVHVQGTFTDPVFFHIRGATNSTWGPLSASGTNSTLELQFAEIAYGQVNAINGAVGLVQDTTLRDFDPGSGAGTLGRPILMCNFANLFQVRRTHVLNYYECLVRNGLIEIEDCLFEQIVGDALDFDSAQPGSFTRRCTYRHGTRGNVDAVDIGPADLPGSTDTLITDCIMWNFPFDKGVSVGDQNSSHGIIVSNCLIYGCNAGVMAKDLCDVSVRNCTIVGNTSGFTNYNKANPGSPTGGGIITNSYNNILWNNLTTIGMANNGQLFADHNDFGSTNWPGDGNIDVDPLFVDAAVHNYRLQTNSPVRGAGRDGADMGVTYPLGGIPMRPLRFTVLGSNAPVLSWIDDSQNEDGVVVQRSTNQVDWEVIAILGPEVINHTDASAVIGQKYYYRAQHTNYVGVSRFSNLASGTRTATSPHLGIALTDGLVHVYFTAESNQSYRVEYKISLELTNWTTWTNILSAPAVRSIDLTNSAPDPTRFYRAVVQ